MNLFKLLPVLTVFAIFQSCTPKAEKVPLLVIHEDKETLDARRSEIVNSTPIKLADGLKLDLWATDSLAPDPIAISIDEQGRVYLTRTNRQKHSEFDIRGFRDWMTPSISFQSVEDRRNFLHTTFATENSEKNNWLADLNQDSIHDWRDLTVEKEEVWRLEDTDNDGMADVSTRIVNDFNDEITDVAGALLVRKNDMFIGVGPDMWRLTDSDKDGAPDKKESIAHGFAVHIGFGGHGMSGVIEGLDGKIYWGIGDIGANLTTVDGRNLSYPNQGVIVRSNPDGSDFEVFAAGVRNTHEFTFDNYGNLIAADNDGDYPGESERLVHIIDGHDAGWRSNWQYGKYTDPKNNRYNVWMDEKLFVPRWEGQAAYIIPPIRNYHNGPTGMVFNPGTALGSKWTNKFFLVEFVGSPTSSHIWSFDLKPKGASFDFNSEVDVLSGVLPTGIRFGTDGSLFMADWVNGWGTKNYGRIWKLDVDDDNNDLAEERKMTQSLMEQDFSKAKQEELSSWLDYSDQRIRMKAQFELVSRDEEAWDVLISGSEKLNQLGRIHSIWGLGQIAKQSKKAVSQLYQLLQDNDSEIVAQSLKVLGDIRNADNPEEITRHIGNENPRVAFFATQAAGRIGITESVPEILEMIRKNDGEDIYLRQVGVIALSRIKDEKSILALSGQENWELKLAGILVLRKWSHPEIEVYLNETDEYLLTETARAINDDFSIMEALPALAAQVNREGIQSEPFIRRAINANVRVGGVAAIERLIHYAEKQSNPTVLRTEALDALSSWVAPSVLDRVDGRYRGEIHHDVNEFMGAIQPKVQQLLADKNPEVQLSAVELILENEIQGFEGTLVKLWSSAKNEALKATLLKALQAFKVEQVETYIVRGFKDPSEMVRRTALGMLNDVALSEAQLNGIVTDLFKNGTYGEQQQLIIEIAKKKSEESSPIFAAMLQNWESGILPSGVKLELSEAINSGTNKELISRLDEIKSSSEGNNSYSEVLYGGNSRMGRRYFFTQESGQCTRCHSIQPQEGTVGPILAGIGSRLTREQILQALVEPSTRIAPGYGTITIEQDNGEKVTGIFLEEKEDEYLIKSVNAEPLRINKKRISKVTYGVSAMPPMGSLLSKAELRDLVEFLSNLKEE